MKNWGKTFSLSSLALLATACGLRVEIQCGSSGFNENSSNGKDYAWHDGISLQYRFAENVPEELRASVTEGAKQYNNVFEKTRITFLKKHAPEQVGNKNQVSGDGINGIYIVDEENWFFYKSNPGAVAVTNNIYSSSEILETDIFYLVKSLPVIEENEESETARHPSSISETLVARVNKVAFDLLASLSLRKSLVPSLHSGHLTHAHALTEKVAARGMRESEYDSIKAEAFTVHELGHSLGLCHTDNKESIMRPEIRASAYKDKPLLSDYDQSILNKHYEIAE